MKNLTAFKALIVLYKSITLKDIDKSAKRHVFTNSNSDTVANDLTGFGGHSTCPLCKGTICGDCTYNTVGDNIKLTGMCYKGINADTYHGIMNALDRTTLKKAFQARAKHMETILLLIK